MLVGSARTRLDVTAVSASLDICPWFVLGGDGEVDLHSLAFGDRAELKAFGVAWHVGALYHHSRVLVPPEAPCEGKGSFIRLLWNIGIRLFFALLIAGPL